MTENVTLKDIYEITARIDEKFDKLSDRVSVLEIWRANIMGKVAIIVAVATLVISLTIDTIKRKVLDL